MDKSVVILGSTGTLGNFATEYFRAQVKDHTMVTALNREHFDAAETWHVRRNILNYINKGDVVINCVGVLKPEVEKVGRVSTININTVFPQILSEVCEEREARMFHICSDCVFSGAMGSYTERDVCDADDLYAKTKSIAPSGCATIRTSFVGPSLQDRGLLEWVRMQSGKTIQGYTNCMWNGMTCLELCKFIHECISNNNYWQGVLHAFTHRRISKYELCKLIGRVYDVDVNVVPAEATEISGTKINGVLDRTLYSVHSSQLGHIRTTHIDEQLIAQKEFLNYHRDSK